MYSILVCEVLVAQPPLYTVTTIAGTNNATPDGSLATTGQLGGIYGMALAPDGALYLSDFNVSGVRRIAPGGRASLFAGSGVAGFAGDRGPAVEAMLNRPEDLVLDAAGNLYISDSGNHRVRRVSTSGVITTVAGNGKQGYSGDGASAINAQLDNPGALAVDARGNLYIADRGNWRIRMVTPAGTIQTAAGTGAMGSLAVCRQTARVQAAEAQFCGITSLALDSAGRLLIADYYLRRLETTGEVSVLSNSLNPFQVSVDAEQRIRVYGWGPLTPGSIQWSRGLFDVSQTGAVSVASSMPALPIFVRSMYETAFQIDSNGTVYVGYSNSPNSGFNGIVVRFPFRSDSFSLIAGGSTPPPGRIGQPAPGAWIGSPGSLVVDREDNLLFPCIFHICKITREGVLELVKGGTDIGDGGPVEEASIFSARSVSADNAGNLYVADSDMGRIRKITPQGVVSTVAGSTVFPEARYFLGENGPATAARIVPDQVVMGPESTLYFKDTDGERLRISQSGIISRTEDYWRVADAAGNIYSYSLGRFIKRKALDGTETQIGNPGGAAAYNFVALDAAGNVYGTEYNGSRIFRITPTNGISVLAGTGQRGFSGDGGPAGLAQLNIPGGITVARSGVVVFADTYNHRIRAIGTDGIIRTIAGNGQNGYSGDGGPATSAQLSFPMTVALDPLGNTYFTDSGKVVRKVSTDGRISTFLGPWTRGKQALTAAPGAHTGITIDASGNIVLLNDTFRRVERITPQGTMQALPTLQGRHLASDTAGNVWVGRPDGLFRMAPGGALTFAAAGDPLPCPPREEVVVNGLAAGEANELYLATRCSGNHVGRVRRFIGGSRLTVAGGGDRPASEQYVPANEVVINPSGVAADQEGNLYIADEDRAHIRMVTRSGKIVTIAGTGEHGFTGDGVPALTAQFRQPRAMTVDSQGRVYVTDGNFIRMLTPVPARVEEQPLRNAASWVAGPVARDSLFLIEGVNLSSDVVASTPGQSTLDGITVTISDSGGAPRPLRILAVSPSRLVCLMDADAELGEGTLNLARGTVRLTVPVTVASFSPGVFSAAADGKGVVSGVVIRKSAGGTQSEFPAYECKEGRCAAVPIVLQDSEETFLEIRVTGVRRASEMELRVRISTLDLLPFSVNPDAETPGVDRIIVKLPAELAGSGEVLLSVQAGEFSSNQVSMEFR